MNLFLISWAGWSGTQLRAPNAQILLQPVQEGGRLHCRPSHQPSATREAHRVHGHWPTTDARIHLPVKNPMLSGPLERRGPPNSGPSDSVPLSQDHGKTRNRRLLVPGTSCVKRQLHRAQLVVRRRRGRRRYSPSRRCAGCVAW